MDQCGICGNRGDYPRIVAREMMFGTREEFEYFQCGECGCVQIAPIPEDLSRYYPDDYYSFDTPVDGVLKRFLKKKRAEHLLGRKSVIGAGAARAFGIPDYFAWIRESGVRSHDSILDVGSGSGGLLRELSQAGFTKLVGMDPYVGGDVTYPDGVRIVRRRLDEMDGEYDLIMMHHSFEHVPDPREALGHVRRLLMPGGSALVRIPVADSRAWRSYGADWVQLDPPRHLFLHTERSVRHLAAGAGLELTRVVHDSTAFQFWGSEQYRRDIPLTDPQSYQRNPSRSSFTREEIRRWQKQAEELNRAGEGDQACFYLRRGTA